MSLRRLIIRKTIKNFFNTFLDSSQKMVLMASNSPLIRDKGEQRKFKSYSLESYFFLLVHMETLREEKKELEGYRGAVSTRSYFCREVFRLHRRALQSIFRFISPTQVHLT